MFENKMLLIVGGIGSFGSAVLRRFLQSDVAQIRIFSRDEKKQEDMRHAYRDLGLKFYIGDVRAYGSVLAAMRAVDIVSHAAALEHVPTCETQLRVPRPRLGGAKSFGWFGRTRCQTSRTRVEGSYNAAGESVLFRDEASVPDRRPQGEPIAALLFRRLLQGLASILLV